MSFQALDTIVMGLHSNKCHNHSTHCAFFGNKTSVTIKQYVKTFMVWLKTKQKDAAHK